MYKAVGVALIFLGGFFISGRMNKRAESELRLTDSWISLMRYIKGQVECFGMPLENILSKCDRMLLYELGYKKESAPKDFSELISGCDMPDEETAGIISEYAKEFGKYYREEQLKRCNYFLSALEEKRKQNSEKLPQKKRLNTTLWIAGSLAVGILLVLASLQS